jgi:hypothetical protein
VTLFPPTISKTKRSPSRPIARDRSALRLATGAPRLVESSTDRAARASVEAWQAMVEAVQRSASARLELLGGRSGSERVSCPWERITSCDVSCRCRGSGMVTIGFLRDHYERLALEIAMLVTPMPSRRSS